MTPPVVPLKRLVDPARPITYGIVQAGPDAPGGIPYIRPVDMTPNNGVINSESLQRTTLAIAHSYQRSTVTTGDLIVSIGPSYGKIMIVPHNLAGANLTQGTARVAPAPGTSARYLYWALQSAIARQFWDSSVGGATFRALNLEPLGRTPVPLIALEEQCRIADFLDAETARIDSMRRMRRRMSDLLMLKRERVVGALLGLNDTAADQRFVPLKYLAAEVVVGIVITPAKWYVESGGIPALRGLNVRPGHINTQDLVQISTQGHGENRKSHLKTGDVVVVRTGQAGAAAVIPDGLDGANCIDLIIIRPGTHLSPHYLEYVLNSEHAINQVSRNSVGSIQSHFNVSTMKSMPIPSISRTIQDKIVQEIDDRVSYFDNIMVKFKRQEELLSERRHALITAAVTGQFDVSAASGRGITEGMSS